MAAKGKEICGQYSAETMVNQISDLYGLLQDRLSSGRPIGAILATP